MTSLTRRGFLGLGLGAAAAATLGACSGGSSGGGGDLRISWYGGQPAHTAMDKALAGWSGAHPDAPLTTERAAFADYWDKLATQVAGRDGPDVFRMSMTYFADYAERGALADLAPVAGSGIRTADLDEDVAGAGRVGQALYGIGQSSITHATFANPALAKKVGADLPTAWDWKGFEDFVTGYAGEAGDGQFGSSDPGGNLQIFEVYARQNGGDLFAERGLAVGRDVVEEWFALWNRLRSAKAVPPAAVTTESAGFENSVLSRGKAPIEFGWVQQVSFYQPLVDDPLVIQAVPGATAGSLAGQFVTALDFWCVDAASEKADDAHRLVDYLLNEDAAIDALGVTLGVPPSDRARTKVKASADAAGRGAIAFVDKVLDQVGPAPKPWPKGYGEVNALFARTAEEIGFGRSDPARGAAAFTSGAAQILTAG